MEEDIYIPSQYPERDGVDGQRTFGNGGTHDTDIISLMQDAGFECRGKFEEWSLVLEAIGIPFQLRGSEILVSQKSLPRARENLQAYEFENLEKRESGELQKGSLPWGPNLLVLGSLLVFFSFLNSGFFGGEIPREIWVKAGAADSSKILEGEWWRSITALTLHGDPAHVLGNVVFGTAFVVLVCSRVGMATGWAAVILSGWLGNMVNAWVKGPGHVSIGFSTAVFAAAGIMVSIHRNRRGLKNGLDAVVMALALLALLGSGGKNTDLGAHFWGVVCGMAVGSVLRFLPLPLLRARVMSSFLAAGTVFLLVYSWFLALG